MKSYDQYCGLALALDRVGGRWTLLIVRELLVAPRRFSELRRALPGLAPNLLSARLQQLQRDGLVERRAPEPTRRGGAYHLTAEGRALEEAVHALVRWGGRFMRRRAPEQVFEPQWLVVAIRALLADPPDDAAFDAELAVDGAVLRLHLAGGVVRLGPRDEQGAAGLRITGPAEAILGLFAGAIPIEQAVERGLIQAPAAPAALGGLRLALGGTRPT